MSATSHQARHQTALSARARVKDLLMRDPAWPEAEGLFDPALEKDSCGVGFIADIKGRKSHALVEDAIQILCNLEHRGAVGADPRAGDGAGLLVQTPHKFFERKARELNIDLPGTGQYAVGFVFMPHEPAARQTVGSSRVDLQACKLEYSIVSPK